MCAVVLVEADTNLDEGMQAFLQENSSSGLLRSFLVHCSFRVKYQELTTCCRCSHSEYGLHGQDKLVCACMYVADSIQRCPDINA